MTDSENTIYDLIIINGTALLPDASAPHGLKSVSVDIAIKDGLIACIASSLGRKTSKSLFDAKGLYVLPGLMDTQVHFREPGLEYKENLRSGTRAALLGGITAVFEMPNTHPSTSNEMNFRDKLKRAEKSAFCDYAFYIGATPQNLNEIETLENLPACCGIKVFLGSSTGDLLIDDYETMKKLVTSGKKRIAAHCEDEDTLKSNFNRIKPHSVKQHPEWRDETSALMATTHWTRLCVQAQRPTHILHVSSRMEMEYLTQLKKEQPYISVEVTPQHLSMEAPQCYESLGSKAQMNPPIRTAEHCKALWLGLKSGTVDIIGSDHAPHTLEEKLRPYPMSPSGMPGVQTIVPIMLDHVYHKRLSLEHLVQLMTVNPIRLFNIKKQGEIRVGHKANLTLVDLKKEQTITDEMMESLCRWTPFHNKKVTGWPQATLLHGSWAMREGEILTETPLGQAIEFST